MLFLLLCVASAQPFYQASLRHLPVKLREQRILSKVQQDVHMIQNMMIDEASNNRTLLNFTLYCIDPNRQYREALLWNNHLGRVPNGLIRVPHYSIPMSYGIGHYEYQRQGPRYRYSSNEERELKTELIEPRPYCNPKHGHELYQRLHGKLEDSHQSYTTLFFQKLNAIFPDIELTVSNNRPSDGLYDSDCCPLFTVSW
jgi:hypothetical protein